MERRQRESEYNKLVQVIYIQCFFPCFQDEDEMVVQLGNSGEEGDGEDPLSFIPTPDNSDEDSEDEM